MFVRKYHSTLRKIPQQHRSHLHSGSSLKSLMLSLIYWCYMHSEHMSTAREPTELLHILVIFLAAVCKLPPPLTKLVFFFMLHIYRLYSVIRRRWLRKARKGLNTIMVDSKEIRAENNALFFLQTQPSFIQVWLHVSVYQDHHQANIIKTFKIKYNIVQLYLLHGIPYDLQRLLQCRICKLLWCGLELVTSRMDVHSAAAQFVGACQIDM